MTWWLTLRTAWVGLRSNRFRTLLTMSGILVGVAALIATLAVGRGSRDAVDAKLEGMGRDSIYIEAAWRPIQGIGGRTKRYRLQMSDWTAIAAMNDVKRATPLVWDQEQVIYNGTDVNPTILGVASEFLPIYHWAVVKGRTFNDDEAVKGANVALLANGTAKKLFAADEPVGKHIRIGRAPFEVIGVLEARGGGDSGVVSDDMVLVPIATAQIKLMHYNIIHEIVAEPKRIAQIDGVAEQIVNLLCDRNRCRTEAERKAFTARTSVQMLKNSTETSNTFAILIFLTASLCLLVGGVGITNTMMMSVFERTREIGVRAALGARPSDIMGLFLTEALLLTGTGGLLGIVAGTQLSIAVSKFTQWPPVISLGSMLLSFGCATGVGLLSGLYPAWRASRMDPVECLRSD